MSRILMLSFHYPPDTAIGALRLRKMSRYFRESGLEHVVITATDDAYGCVNPESLDDVDGLEIHRISCPRSILVWFIKRAKDGKALLFPESAIGRDKEGGSFEISRCKRPEEQTLYWLRRLVVMLRFCPDDKLFWGVKAAIKAISLSRKERFSCVFSSGPPHSTALMAWLVAKVVGLPLVLDYRDPWTVGHEPQVFAAWAGWMRSFFSWLERRMIRQADLLVINTEACAERLLQENIVDPNKVLVAYNGHDMVLDDVVVPAALKDKILLSHFGTLYLKRDPTSFFKALGRLVTEHTVLRETLQVSFYGESEYPIEDIVANSGCSAVTTIHDSIPHGQALRKMNEADILLAFSVDQPLQVPAKIFEYTGCGKAIMLVGSHGATSDLLERNGCGLLVDIHDENAIYDALMELIVERGYLRYSQYDRSTFSRKLQFEPLVQRLKQLQAV